MQKTSFDLYDYWQTVNTFSHIYALDKNRFDELLLRRRKAELCALLTKVIRNELNEQDQLLIRLHWYQGKNADELSELLGLDRSSVYRRIERITNTLFEKLNEALLNLETALDKYVDSPAYDEAEALRTEVETGINGLTNAQAEEYISKITEMLTKLRLPSEAEIAQASDQAPLDMTSVILAPSFENDEWGYPENSNEGWNNPGNLGNGASDTQADQKLCFAMEFWQIAFDLYQEFSGMPAGTYMLQVDGWVRNGNNDENYTQWQTNPEASMAFLYAKDGEDTYYSAPLANMMKAAPTENIPFITVDGDEIYELVETTLGETAYWLPNTMIGGRSYLDLGKENGSIEGAYTSKVILKVKEDGKLRIGVKKEQQKDNSWVVIDNFRLFYYGANSSLQPSGNALTVESIAMGQPVKVEFFTLDGRKVNSMQKGIMIQKVTLDNGNVVVRKIRY